MNIREIEALTEDQARAMALEIMSIKEHTVYIIDEGGYFGYSALVFKNGRHIHYANDYALHHNGRDREWLRKWYVETLNGKLFTETEICGAVKNYDEYRKKEDYLRNYYPMQVDYVSQFRILHNKAEEDAFDREIAGLHYNPVSFCYMADEEFIKHHVKLFATLQERKAELNNAPEYWKDAFKREMYNHEYAINWQADYDTLSAFGNVKWHNGEGNVNQYFDDLGFNDIQRKAYKEAKREYYKECREKDMF